MSGARNSTTAAVAAEVTSDATGVWAPAPRVDGGLRGGAAARRHRGEEASGQVGGLPGRAAPIGVGPSLAGLRRARPAAIDSVKLAGAMPSAAGHGATSRSTWGWREGRQARRNRTDGVPRRALSGPADRRADAERDRGQRRAARGRQAVQNDHQADGGQ